MYNPKETCTLPGFMEGALIKPSSQRQPDMNGDYVLYHAQLSLHLQLRSISYSGQILVMARQSVTLSPYKISWIGEAYL